MSAVGHRPHYCDDACVCFIDGSPLLYNEKTALHACVDMTCHFAHGYESRLRDTWEELRDCAGQMEEFRRELARTLALPADPLPEVDKLLRLLMQQYNSLRLALGQAAGSFGILPGETFARNMMVAVVSAEEVDGWQRTARYTRLADTPLTATHSVSSVDSKDATPTEGNSTMVQPEENAPEPVETDAEESAETGEVSNNDDSAADDSGE